MDTSTSAYVGVRRQALAQGGGAFVHQHHSHVETFDVRAGGPVEQRDYLLRSCRTQTAGLAVGDQERRVVDQDRRADAFLGHDVVLHEAVEQCECSGGILTRSR
jgi:hypothetical protein